MRTAWLILAADDLARDAVALVRGADVVVTADVAFFLRQLAHARPRIVVCAEPPADSAVLEAVLRERRRRSGMRAVHLAAPDEVARRLEALASGFDDALPTAIPAAELAGRLAWLDARASAASVARVHATVLPITDDLVLDLEAHALWRNELQVHLRPKEYALLRLLASNPGRAMSRPELLRLVWGPDRSVASRTVDVHVRWLRAKIEPDPDDAVRLVTVRGVGYRFDPPN
jgi:DNA-binding response OmpR family regulator